MPELLLELGCEELPASFVRRAYTDLEAAISTRLTEAGIPFGASQSMGTPRRLIVQIEDVSERQPDAQKEQRGPAISAAYDSEGKPTKALEGFCRGQGVDLSAVRKEGEYVWATKTTPGRPTKEVLSELLPDAIRSLTFDKAMRWGNLRMRFARPIRWILAAFGGTAVDFQIEGIEAGLESRGHRFNAPGSFVATGFTELVTGLRNRQVEPDATVREKTIIELTPNATAGNPEMTNALVEENVFLTEWPQAIEGAFREEYLELPDPVLVTAMAKHERFFPVRDSEGKLTNRFVSIRNGGVDEVVSAGNSWVLNARFNDAKFFYDEDLQHSMGDFLENTKGVVYQDKLGTVYQRAFRLSELSAEVAKVTGGGPDEVELARKAGLYAKADLTTGLVSELPALQGLIGGEYARREGMPDAVCWAIASHYDLVKNPTIDCEGARTAVRVLLADQLDKLAGYLGIGKTPSGSSDPYGLRRAATLLVEAAVRWPTKFPGYRALFEVAQACYREQGFELADSLPQLAEIFRSRYDAIFEATRHDLIDAALLEDYSSDWELLDPQGVRFRISVLEALANDVTFIQTATRPQNILSAAVNKGVAFNYERPLETIDGGELQSPEGETLLALARELAARIRNLAFGSFDALVDDLGRLQEPVNQFFDSTMVMAENEAVRTARLTLLHGVNLLLREAGDFSRIVIPGE